MEKEFGEEKHSLRMKKDNINSSNLFDCRGTWNPSIQTLAPRGMDNSTARYKHLMVEWFTVLSLFITDSAP